MGYETLKDKLQDIFDCSRMKREHQDILMSAYLNPGVEVTTTIADQSSQQALKDLVKRGLLCIREVDGVAGLFPIPIAILLKKEEGLFSGPCLEPLVDAIHSIDKWIQYPIMRIPETQMKSSREGQTVMQWLFDLHMTDWDQVFCFGDYESFIESIGFDTETEWIKERIKKGRKASVVATQDGQWARHIHELSQSQLRDCLINPKDFEGLFIMAFPDVDTTVMGGRDDEVTFIHSRTVAHHYGNLVNQQLQQA